MSQTFTQTFGGRLVEMSLRMQRVTLLAVLLAAFALYAPGISLALIHDDVPNAFWLSLQSLGELWSFTIRPGNPMLRPVAHTPWVLTRELFGWFIPSIIHAWNIWAHNLNTVLVFAVARALSRRANISSTAIPVLAATLFAFFPFSHQAIIWAVAIGHPAYLMFGLAAILASLQVLGWPRWVVTSLLLALACLAHESAFLFGPILALTHIRRWRVQPVPLALAAICMIYGLAIRFVLIADQFAMGAPSAFRPGDILPNFLYFCQGFASWLVSLLRPIVGLTPFAFAYVGLAFCASVGLGCGVLFMRSRKAGILGIGVMSVWLIATIPAVFGLDRQYVATGPRLLYASSAAVAIFWSLVIWSLARGPGRQIALVLAVLIGSGLSARSTHDLTAETQRVSDGLFAIDRDLRSTAADANLTIVNTPWWNARASPNFLLGAEGMPIYQHEFTVNPWWVGAQSGTSRNVILVQYANWNTSGVVWTTATYGQPMQDSQVRAAVLKSTLVYRWDFDAPGTRVTRLARVRLGTQTPAGFRARLHGDLGDVFVTETSASLCNGQLTVDIGWYVSTVPVAATGVLLHGFDALSSQVLNSDGDPLNGILPLSEAEPNMTLIERRVIALEPNVANRLDHLDLGLYLKPDFKPFAATDQSNLALDGNVVRVEVGRKCA